MKVHETRSQAHAPGAAGQQGRMMTRKQKAGNKGQDGQQSPKKARNGSGSDQDGKRQQEGGGGSGGVENEYEEFAREMREHLSVGQMREILRMNDQDPSGTEGVVITKCQDLLFFGPLERCQRCNEMMEFDGKRYSCNGFYSEWSSCTYKPKNPPRKEQPTKLPDSVQKSPIGDMVKKYQDPSRRPRQGAPLKPLTGMMITLMGRLSRTHQYWKNQIEKHGGKVHSSIKGVNCVVASPAERERGGSGKLADAMEQGVRVVREEWLADSIEKQEAQPLEAYDLVSDLAVEGKGIPRDKQDPSEEALESMTTEVKVYGKRGVHKDTKLQEQGGAILERDGILYNCAFSLCDIGRGMNDFCIMQLITVPDANLNLYYKKGRIGDDANAEERLEEWEDVDSAIKEFVQLFEDITGNEFEPWERQKKFEKKRLSFFPVDMDDGFDARHGGLALRQLGVAAIHTKLDPRVANFVKILCSQEVYRYALMEMGYDPPDLPIGMLSKIHLDRTEQTLLEFVEAVKSLERKGEKGEKAEAVWSDYSQRWFNLMPSIRPFIMRDYNELADNAASAFESVRDIIVASHLIGDMSGSTLDDPLSDRYSKLGCSITPLEKESGEYEMIAKYLEKTYEPVKVGDIEYGVSIESVFAVESNAWPSLDDMKNLPNKVLLWCGTRSSNLLRHLQKGFLPSICQLPVPGYMFGKAIVCSDAAAEAARYGFTAVDRPEGFLVLAVASLGEQIVEVKNPPEDVKSYEEKKIGVKGLGKKKTDESEHFTWKDDVKIPCGRLIPSEHKDSPLDYNEYAVYDPKQTSIRFLVGVKYEEQGVVMDTDEP